MNGSAHGGTSVQPGSPAQVGTWRPAVRPGSLLDRALTGLLTADVHRFRTKGTTDRPLADSHQGDPAPMAMQVPDPGLRSPRHQTRPDLMEIDISTTRSPPTDRSFATALPRGGME